MTNLYVLLLTSLFAVASWATEPSGHPASMAANVPAFLPVDFFAQSQAEMAGEESAHQHGEAASQQAEPETEHDHAAVTEDIHKADDGKGCKRDGGCCCCCRCCKDEKAQDAEMPGCKMMKKGGMMDKGKNSTSKKPAVKPAAKKEDAHEAHH